MKIAILGTSGSGKSTLAKQLGEQYSAPVLHLDAVHFLPGWVERTPEEEKTILSRFLGHRRQLHRKLLCPAVGGSRPDPCTLV